jgi:hypothetical protein
MLCGRSGFHFGFYCVINVVTLDLFLRCINVKAIKTREIAKNTILLRVCFVVCVITRFLSTLLSL